MIIHGERNEQQKSVSKGLLSCLFLITFIVSAAVLLVSFFGLQVIGTNRKIDRMESDWTVKTGVSTVRVSLPGAVRVTSAGETELTRKLPDDVVDGDVMALLLEHQNLYVTVGDDVIYTYEGMGVINEFCGKAYQFIPLTRAMAGQTLRLHFIAATDLETTYISCPVIGGTEAVISYLLRINILTIMFNSMFIIVGAIMLVMALIEVIKKQKGVAGRAALIGGFLLAVGLWQLLETGMLQLTSERESFTYLLEHVCAMIFMIPLLWYYAYEFDFEYSLLELVCQLQLLNIVINIVIFVSGAADLYQLHIVAQFINIMAALILFYVLMIERYKKGVFKITLPIVGAAFLVVATMLDIMCSFDIRSELIRIVADAMFILGTMSFGLKAIKNGA